MEESGTAAEMTPMHLALVDASHATSLFNNMVLNCGCGWGCIMMHKITGKWIRCSCNCHCDAIAEGTANSNIAAIIIVADPKTMFNNDNRILDGSEEKSELGKNFGSHIIPL